MLGKFGRVNVNAEALIANDFHLQGGDARRASATCALSLDAPLKIGRIDPSGACRSAHYSTSATAPSSSRRRRGCRPTSTASTSRPTLNYQQAICRRRAGAARRAQCRLHRQRAHRRRARCAATTDFDVSPAARFRSAELSAYWSATEHVDWEGDLAYDATRAPRARAGSRTSAASNSLALALTGEAASDGSVAFGFNLNFSLDPRHGFTLSRRPLAQGGMVHATVYPRPQRQWRARSGRAARKGRADHDRHAPGRAHDRRQRLGHRRRPHALHADRRRASTRPASTTRCWCRRRRSRSSSRAPALPAEVADRAWSAAATSKARSMKSGELGFEGVDLELVDAAGKVVGTARTDFDGFFLFERVAYGTYTLRVSSELGGSREDRDRSRRQVRRDAPTRRSFGSARSSRRPCRPRRSGSRSDAVSSRQASQGAICRSRLDDGAVEKTRTSTAFRPQRPQRCASTSSATTARHEMSRRRERPALARRGP